MKYLVFLGAIIVVAFHITLSLFRKGGLYKPTVPESEPVQNPETSNAPSQVPTPVPQPPVAPQGKFYPRIVAWAEAIAPEEGGNPALNNPGNLKYSTLTASWGGTPGFQAADGGYICKFPTPQMGKDALCSFLTLGAKDQLLAFHQARTLGAFTKVYANPPAGSKYAENVAARLGITTSTLVDTLLA